MPIPWCQMLESSLAKNFGKKPCLKLPLTEAVRMQFSVLSCHGEPIVENLIFAGCVSEDPTYMTFLINSKNAPVIAAIKTSPKAILSWSSIKTKEIFNFQGRVYVASSRRVMTRYPPPLVQNAPGLETLMEKRSAAKVFWEEKRIQTWSSLHGTVRATFAWTVFKENNMKPPVDLEYFFPELEPRLSPQVIHHDMALDDFCLLVFKCETADHLIYDEAPSYRTKYERLEDGAWSFSEIV